MSACCPTLPQKSGNNSKDMRNSNNNFVVEIGNANKILRGKIPIGPSQEEGGGGANKRKTVELIGRSWAGDSTAFVIPSLGLALDAGYPVYGKRMDNIFVTHAHTDHCHHLTHLKSRTKPPNVYMPAQVVTKAQHFIDAAQQLTSNLTPSEYNEIQWDTTLRFNGVNPGDKIIVDKKKGLICHVVKCDHTVPCVGYCFSQIKQSLKPEYRDLQGPEIGKLRKQGIQVTTQEEQPLFCYLGDTSTSILQQQHHHDDDVDVDVVDDDQETTTTTTSERIFSCPTIIIECSFLTEDCRGNASRTKHVLWTDLKPHIVAHPNTTFVLVHFSHRWNPNEIANFFQKENLHNVIPWIPPAETRLFCQSVGASPKLNNDDCGGAEGAGEEQVEEIEEVWSHF